jgi:hypothetical protein
MILLSLRKSSGTLRSLKVEFLVGELDYLKSTVHLLVTVLFAEPEEADTATRS